VRFHREVLSPRQERSLARLGPGATERGFYLAGGTAIALHLGHRRSVDFDWFLGEAMGDPLRLARDIEARGVPLAVARTARGTLDGRVSGVPVSFLEYRYPLLAPLVEWRAARCQLAALRDLATMKLSAIAQRGAKKDFVDLYALLRSRHTLEEMLADYQARFAVADRVHLLYALSYFDDADRERLPKMLWKVDWRTMKAAIREAVKAF
jgi:hypothetical protein